MKIVSVFDGMSCGKIAFRESGIPVERYVASEVDKYAIQTSSHNFPEIEQVGDVFKVDFTQYEGFDGLIGGSPCTKWSIAQKNGRETEASGQGWDWFCQYVRALKEIKPKFFIYENNRSMSNSIRDCIRETFGFEEVCINSALLSAQNRVRYYWVGIRNSDGTYRKVNVPQPGDRGIMLVDVLDCAYALKDKANCLCGNRGGSSLVHDLTESRHNLAGEPVRVGIMPTSNGDLKDSQGNRIYSIEGKSVTQSAQGGGWGAKTGLYAFPVGTTREGKSYCLTSGYANGSGENIGNYAVHTLTKGCKSMVGESVPRYAVPVERSTDGTPIKAVSGADGKTYTVYRVVNGKITIKGMKYPIKLADGYWIIRKLTVSECMRLQTVPDWFEFPVSNTQAYRQLGNGWTIAVIQWLLRCLIADWTKEILYD